MSSGDLLLVDDDPDLLKLISLRLTSAGYRVRTDTITVAAGEAWSLTLDGDKKPDQIY